MDTNKKEQLQDEVKIIYNSHETMQVGGNYGCH